MQKKIYIILNLIFQISQKLQDIKRDEEQK